MRLGTAQPTPLLGRASELEAIRQRLLGDMDTDDAGSQGGEHVRLLTLTGPAGVGKTRLALAAAAQIADHFPDSVVLVDLTPIRDPSLVLPTIARVLGLADTGGRSLQERLSDFLRERSLLLVLDNFEQVLAAAGALAELLATCPGLALLVTSRAPLRLRWEWALRVAPLAVPDLTTPLPRLDALAEIPAVALFMERARARRADFSLTAAQASLVAQLVSELDGLPLALELAAARLDALSLPTITRRLGDRLRLLHWEMPDLPERQQSLEAAIGWSYDLLSVPERRLFRCLGVFAGQVSLDAIAAVVSAVAAAETGKDSAREEIERASAGDNGRALARLASLAEKSLVLPPRQQRNDTGDDGTLNDEDPEPTFAMLETVREYAWEQLDHTGELKAARRAHAYYFLALAEQANPQLRGPHQRAWYLRLEREHDNLRAALRWLLDQDAAAEREVALRLAGAMGWFWAIRGYPAEGSRWLEEALARAPDGDGGGAAVRTRALLEAGAALVLLGDFTRARALQEEALALARKWQEPATIAQALTYLGTRAVYAGEVAEGVVLLREARTRWETLDDPYFLGLTLNFLGTAALAQGDQTAAAALKSAALERLEAAGEIGFAGTAHFALAAIAQQKGDVLQAVAHVRSGLNASLALQDRRLLSSGARATLALVDEIEDPVQRLRLLGASDILSEATGGTVVGQQEPAHGAVAELRERFEHGEGATAYQEGQSLTFGEVVALALSVLEDIAQAHANAGPLDFVSDSGQEAKRRSERSKGSPLTPREQEVLEMVAQGHSSKAIGRLLFLSASTVNYHLTSVFNKLGVSTRAQAVAVATQRHLL
jgi:predicted ATPase/DNA-binding CsgD family transcriptional regulator